MGAFRGAASTAPAHGAVAITPSDVTVIPVTRSIYVGTTGNINVRMADGQTLVFPTVPVGVLAIQVDQVLSTSTTASNIIALY
jgi:hypothetical protein